MEQPKIWTPTVSQAQFFTNCANPQYVENFFVGGFGCGKTHVMTKLLTDLCHEVPGARIAVVRKYRVDLPETTYAEFMSHVDHDLIVDERKSDFTVVVRSRHSKVHSKIFFKGMDERHRWGSTFFSHILLDEGAELEELEYYTLPGRLRQKFDPALIEFMSGYGCPYLEEYQDSVTGVWATDVHRFVGTISNPTDEFHWMYKICEEQRKSSTSFVRASTYDNWANLPNSYRKIIEEYPPSLKHTKVYGNWGVETVGRPCTPAFNPEINVQDFEIPPTLNKIYVGWDFGYTRPSINFWYIDPESGVGYKFYDVIEQHKRLEDLILLRSKIYDEFFEKWVEQPDIEDYVDHSAGIQHSMSGDKPAVEKLKDFGIRPRHKRTDPKDRVDTIDTLFKKRKLVIHTRCKASKIAYQGGWHYPESGKGDPNLPDKNPKNPYHNLADADGYFIMGVFGAVGRIKETRRLGRNNILPRSFEGISVGVSYGKEQEFSANGYERRRASYGSVSSSEYI